MRRLCCSLRGNIEFMLCQYYYLQEGILTELKFNIPSQRTTKLPHNLDLTEFVLTKNKLPSPGIEPGSAAWKANVLTIRPQELVVELPKISLYI